MIVPVILSGGSGTRLWPLSREGYPKQLLPMTGGSLTLLQETALRVSALPEASHPIVVCNEQHRFMVAAQLQAAGITSRAIILEPVGRNTAPAVAIAALEGIKDGADPVLLVLPADHMVNGSPAFLEAVQCGHMLAEQGCMVTFGIRPSRPETGYGYIRKGNALSARQVPDGETPGIAHQVSAFVEKPMMDKALSYLESGEYLWNSGIFLFKASTYMQELERFAPRIVKYCAEAHGLAQRDLDFLRLHAAFRDCPSDSVDYAIMEKTDRAAVIQLDASWSDVGSWSALHEVGRKDEAQNVLIGDVITEDVKNCYLHASSRMIAAVGLQNHVVVETKDAVLVAHIDRVQDVKTIVTRLKSDQREEAVNHTRVYRPWGSYESVDTGDRFQVKRIVVNPGSVLSLQKHHHRAEHWIVVKGTARITRGEEEVLLTEDQSTYVPLGTLHRLENPGRIPLEIIEVQTGSYLGEDDIVRIDDRYGRT